MSSDYSGMECCKEALRLVTLALQRKDQLEYDVPRWKHVCDNAPLPQKVLLDIVDPDVCVFADLMDRLPTAARDWILAACPADDAKKTEREEAYTQIRKWAVGQCCLVVWQRAVIAVSAAQTSMCSTVLHTGRHLRGGQATSFESDLCRCELLALEQRRVPRGTCQLLRRGAQHLDDRAT